MPDIMRILRIRPNQACLTTFMYIAILVFIIFLMSLNVGQTRVSSLIFKTEIPQFFEASPNLNQDVIIYNRLPKTGSTSFMGLIYDICSSNGFYVLHLNVSKNAHTLHYGDQIRLATNISNWYEKRPAVYHGHFAYLNFNRLGVSLAPIYINLVRRPLDRLISYFYFLRYGDDFRPHLVRRRQGDKMTFDECVNKSLQECDPVNLWMQIPFFCGHAAQCWEPGNRWALEEAKRNLAEHYFMVGVTEELEEFIEVLEFSLPRIFHGSMATFLSGNKSHLRKTNRKFPPTEQTLQKIKKSKIWQMENEFYEFALLNFHFSRKRILESVKNGEAKQQFFYEKIRPKR